ncbi:MAG: hypothetical protein JSR19_00540 [Proteobacteria bacterium]|nr:hypothetical protein [Pseudomonadota bacterium]HQR02926.1 hypothetical protein [Rhodocyclaceae bacterium]
MKTAVGKCLSCERWAGERSLSADQRVIEHAPDAVGLCIGGPWHRTLRETVSACGRWAVWPVLKTRKIPH